MIILSDAIKNEIFSIADEINMDLELTDEGMRAAILAECALDRVRKNAHELDTILHVHKYQELHNQVTKMMEKHYG